MAPHCVILIHCVIVSQRNVAPHCVILIHCVIVSQRNVAPHWRRVDKSIDKAHNERLDAVATRPVGDEVRVSVGVRVGIGAMVRVKEGDHFLRLHSHFL